MADFIRARSSEQKLHRLEEIKAAARALFDERPYHEITLTTIAEKLDWSRANLYKYASTKEEIFLDIASDERTRYMTALLEAFPEHHGRTPAEAAETWADVAAANKAWFRYGDILFAIIEVNVSVERLAAFKGGYYEELARLEERLGPVLGIEPARVSSLMDAVHYHAVGLVGSCQNNPLIQQALDSIGIRLAKPDFRSEMRDFIGMCLEHYRRGLNA